MALVFPYVALPSASPILSLGGRMSRPYPLVRITLIGPTGAFIDRGLIDSGADETVFPEAVTPRIGLDLTNAPQVNLSGVGAVPCVIRYAQVTLRLTDGQEFREWPAWVGFTSAQLKRPLLGFAGFLQFFLATFFGDREQVELVTNPLYPGK